MKRVWNDAFTDRRNAPRWPSAGVMVVRMRGRSVRGRIVDLSTTGVKLRIESLVGIESLAGRDVGVELHLDGAGKEWLYLRGRVVRVSAAYLTIVIAFASVPVDFAEVLDREGRVAIEN